MRKRLIKLTLFGVFIVGCAFATEMRSPWLSERGPIRYKFERGNPDRYSLDIYSTVHRREAHKAFLSHGTDTKPLSALFFNESDFEIKRAFPNKTINPNSMYYNPFMALLTIHPRVTYYEWGANIGGRFEYPVYEDKGRIGLRLNIPFRTIEIERENTADKTMDPLKEYVLGTPTYVARYHVVDGVQNYAAATSVFAHIVKLELLHHLFEGDPRIPVLNFGPQSLTVYGHQIAANFETNNQSFRTNIKPIAGLIYNATNKNRPNDPNFSTWGYTAGALVNQNIGNDIAGVGGAGGYGIKLGAAGPPIVNAIEDRYGWAFDASDNINLAQVPLRAHSITTAIPKPLMNDLVQTPNIAFFNDQAAVANTDYTNYNDYTKWPPDLKNAWLAFGYQEGRLDDSARQIYETLEETLYFYNENVYQWLLRTGGFEFETGRRTGFGDIDLDLFYEHMFSDEWIGELFLGVRFPTGADDDYCHNPYKAHLGNGEHWELRFGGMVAWQPLDWMNVKLDLTGAYAFEDEEDRPAAFEGADIKNIGPCVRADVDWWYFIARLDFTFFHPKTKDLSTTIGYEFYYKTEDDLHFKQATALPFYGEHYLGTPSLAANLSNGLAEKNTEAIGHKIRGEGRIQINKWCEVFAGGSYTFAGQNLPRETDMHGGCIVRF